ncbi:hypothetical protein [Nocardia pseudovaccinii]|uniref:hypothetical protein n=1 Tax=Nocardia pseudovaccinii TaxID=189540 RepID=UPI0035A25755
MATDIGGLLLAVVVAAASIQDRDAAHRLLVAVAARFTLWRCCSPMAAMPGG